MDTTPTSDTLQIGTIVVGLLGGLALFLFGMEQMTDALKTVAGNRLKAVLDRLTTNRFYAAFAGAFITAVIQSSSVTTVLVVGFITAGLMTLIQSIGVIMGANVGTTITAQIIAFKVTKFAMILIFVGFFVLFTAKRERARSTGVMIMGLGLIFFGMDLMSQATAPLRTYPPFIDAMSRLESPLTAIILSALFTALVQSSSATTGVVIVLASQGFITLDTGIALIFGANIGTCITALLASIGKPTEAVQAAMVHVLFNVFGVLLWFPFIALLAGFVRELTPAAGTPRQIANAHTIFNVANTLLFLPFVAQIAWLVRRMVPERILAMPTIIQPKYLDPNLLSTPELGLDRARLEIGRLGMCAQRMVWKSAPAVLHGTHDELAQLAEMDADVDALQGAIVRYLGELSQRNLLHDQTEKLYDYMAVATYIENIGDMVETNLVEAGEQRLANNVRISSGTQEAIYALHERVCRTVEQALAAVADDDKGIATDVINAKPEINRLADAIDSHLAQRLVADEPNRLGAYRVESDIVENYRRIYYFAKRVAKAIAEEDMPRRVAVQATTPQFQAYAATVPAKVLPPDDLAKRLREPEIFDES
jgi:phosphate:Na+ symporter